MGISWRIGLLAVFLAVSVAAIVNVPTAIRMLIAIAIVGIFLIANYLKSKPGRIFIILILMFVVVFLISSSFEPGVKITSVELNSVAAAEGLKRGDVITHIDGQLVLSIEQYSQIVDSKYINNESVRIDITTTRLNNDVIILSNIPPEITVKDVSRTNLKTGLDISGGARALIQPETAISAEEMDELIDVSRNRFNIFGIADVEIRSVTDFAGNRFMLVEVAGATPDDLEKLLSQQGKFEAKIGNETVFIGGEKDITDVCRNDASCATVTSCFQSGGGFLCRYQFRITLKSEAADRHADITANIPVDPSSGGQYLTENLTLILDDQVVDELLISTSLKGVSQTLIQIQGSGEGATEDEAFNDALQSMSRLQTILRTGSLPFKLEIVKLDTISPILGSQFVKLIIGGGIGAILVVSIIIFIRYRKVNLSLALLLTAFSELLIILGIAALIGWNLDLPSIAGILATVGTGIDQQIIIIDEARSGRETNLNQRLKRALFIVVAAYFTSVAALFPLFWAGAGLFKGFAITALIGITAGVLITRPAFAKLVEMMEN